MKNFVCVAVLLVSNCAAFGGVLATTAVPAGNFNTCAVPVNQNGQTGTIWVGAVPWGVVSADVLDTTNGQHYVLNLQSYHMGQF